MNKNVNSSKETKNQSEARIAQTGGDKIEIIEQGGYTFYNETYELSFPVGPKQYKNQYDLMLNCVNKLLTLENNDNDLKLLPMHKETILKFDYLKPGRSLTTQDKNKLSTGFTMILRRKNSSYLGWKTMKTELFVKHVCKTNKPGKMGDVFDESPYVSQSANGLPVNVKSSLAADFSLTINCIIKPLTELFQSDYTNAQSKELWNVFLNKELKRSFKNPQKGFAVHNQRSNHNSNEKGNRISFEKMEKIAYCSFEKGKQKNIPLPPEDESLLTDAQPQYDHLNGINTIGINQKEDMINFLKNSTSLYYYLCGWFLKQNIKFDNTQLAIEQHHIIPVNQIKTRFQLETKNQDADYNLIRIPYLLHIMLHFIRYLEWDYNTDCTIVKNAIEYLQKIERKNNFFSNVYVDVSETVLNLVKVLDFMTFHMKNHFYITKERLSEQENARKAIDENTEKKLHSTLKESFAKEMIWENIRYDVYPNPLIIEAERVKRIDSLRLLLTAPLVDFFNHHPNVEPPSAYKNLISNKNYLFNSRLRLYLRGLKISKAGILGWVIKTPNQDMIKKTKKFKFDKSRKNTGHQIIEMLDKGGYTWYYLPPENKGSGSGLAQPYRVEPITITPGKFSCFADLVSECINRLPSHLKPTGLNNRKKHSDVKSRFQKVFKSVIIDGRFTSYLGWSVRKDI